MGFYLLCLGVLFITLSPCEGSAFNFEVAARVLDNINFFTSLIEKSLDYPLTVLNSNRIDAFDMDEGARKCLFLAKRSFTEISSLYIGFDNSIFLAYGEIPGIPFDTFLFVSRPGPNDTHPAVGSFINIDGMPTGQIFAQEFNPKGRPWFQVANALRKPFWPTPYLDGSTGNPIISLVYPLLNFSNNGMFYPFGGAVAVDVGLGLVNSYLQKSFGSTDMHVVLIDKDTGYLLGSSFYDAVAFDTLSDGTKVFIKAEDSPHPLISSTVQVLIRLNWPSELIVAEPHYVQNTVYQHEHYGLSWRIVVMLSSEYPLNYIPFGSGTYNMIVFAVVLSFLFSVLGLTFIVRFRNFKLILLTNPAFTVALLIGGIITSIAVYFNLGENTEHTCRFRPYLFNIAFVLVFSPVLLKSWFLYVTFVLRGETDAYILIDIRTLITSITGMSAAVCLLIWLTIHSYTPVTSLKYSRGGVLIGKETVCGYEDEFDYVVVIFTYKFTMLGAACLLSLFNSKSANDLLGSKSLLVIVINTAFINAMAALSAVTIPDPQSIQLAQSLGVCFCLIVDAIVLIFPIYYKLYAEGDEAADKFILLAEKYRKERRHLTARQKHEEQAMVEWLQDDPIQSAIAKRVPLRVLKSIFKHNQDCMNTTNFYGQSVYDVAVNVLTNVDTSEEEIEYMVFIVRYYLPFDPASLNERVPEQHGYVWTSLVQSPKNLRVVQCILDEFHDKAVDLAQSVDEKGRTAVSIASPACSHAIKLATYFFKRYEILTSAHPIYTSKSCIVHLAVDHQADGKNVALKFMNEAQSFKWEVSARSAGYMDEKYVVSVLNCHNGDEDPQFIQEVKRRGFGKFRFCIVMIFADKDLQNIISNERIAGREWDVIRVMFTEVILALQHVHSKCLIHGDIKPTNIMRSENRLKLIDFGNCSSIPDGLCNVRSTAYCPPEALYRDLNGKVAVRRADDNMQSSALRARGSFDLWSAGVFLFELCTGSKLFPPDVEDNTDEENLEILFEFTSEFKERKLSRIADKNARNLVSQLLTRDPKLRPCVEQILCHPFIINQDATRMIGEPAEFDVFISYRVSSDALHAQQLYEKLTALGLKPWWDKVKLKPGVPWEEGFCDGLVLSRVFVPILSRGAVNNPSDKRCFWPELRLTSAADNVLLEHRLALELYDRGLIEKIIPLYVGDKLESQEYSDCRLSGCLPDLRDPLCLSTVLSVEDQLRGHLRRLCLGPPVVDALGVKQVFDRVTEFPGVDVVGSIDVAMNRAVDCITSIVASFE